MPDEKKDLGKEPVWIERVLALYSQIEDSGEEEKENEQGKL
jgi:hypothetical protein